MALFIIYHIFSSIILNMEDENKTNKKQPRISQSKLISKFEARYKDAFYYLPELKS